MTDEPKKYDDEGIVRREWVKWWELNHPSADRPKPVSTTPVEENQE